MAMLSIPTPINIRQILQDIELDGEIVRKDPSDHITIFYMDNFDMDDVLKIIPIVSEVVKDIKSFNIGVDSYTSFPEGKYGWPCVSKIKSKELVKMRNKIKKALDENDIKYSTKFKEFIPHVTISYQTKEVKNKKIDEIIWPVKNIALYAGDSNNQTLYIEFPLGSNKEKYSSECLDDIAGQFEKLAKL